MILRPLLTIKQTFGQIGRNFAMTLASLFSITAILLILGFFFIILVNVNNISESVKENFGEVQVNLLDEADATQTQLLMDKFTALHGVKDVSLLTREQALENMKQKWGDNAYLLNNLKVNPLPNAIIVSIEKLEDAQGVIEAAKSEGGIERVNYAQDVVDQLIKITNGIQLGAVILIICLLIISVIVVSNTIKLTVLAREREITIMRYIGATNWYIRGPFLLEGMFIGLLSALVSCGAVAGVYHYIVENFSLDFALILSRGLVSEQFLVQNLLIIFVALGISIGACGSIISMRRFLRT
ncbi:MAG: permease-like cell division protein FtsX [Clostridiales Family XIII bacterium]|jgi:cell division transport system permease protein|nr:permease-like cell division protein FtsX [Clostridiales Family XIII bacterium]